MGQEFYKLTKENYMEKLIQAKEWFMKLEKKKKIAIAIAVVIVLALLVG